MVRRVLVTVAENLPPGILLQGLQFESHLIVSLLRLHGDTLPGSWIFSVVWMDIPSLSLLVRRSLLRDRSSQQVYQECSWNMTGAAKV
jgi:hypothetical protein